MRCYNSTAVPWTRPALKMWTFMNVIIVDELFFVCLDATASKESDNAPQVLDFVDTFG